MAPPGPDRSVRKNIKDLDTQKDENVRKNTEDEFLAIDEVLVDVPMVVEAHDALVDEVVVHEPLVDDMGKDKVVDDVENVKRVIDKGKGIMIDDVPIVRRKMGVRNKGIVIEENVNSIMYNQSETDSDNEQRVNDSDSDSEYSDQSFDYLSECEDEVRELRKRKSDAKRALIPPKQNINIGNVGTSKPKRVHDFGDSETLIEHEEFMNDLMWELKGANDEMEDPFKIVETKVEKYPIHDEDTHWRLRKPHIGDRFVNAEQFKECLTYYALANGFSLWFYRSSKNKVIANCGFRPENIKDKSLGKQAKFNKYPSIAKDEGSKCPWRCYGKMMTTEASFQVISLNDKHTCVRNFKYGTLIDYKWIGKHFGPKIRQNPEIKLHEIGDLVMKKYKCIVSPTQCRNAKRWALNEGESTIEDHYGLIRSYAKAILESNDGSTVKVGVTVNPDNKTYFDRFYVCFNGLKEGWKLGCRKVIALDGCFLKKPNVGEILTAIGRDGNNHIFPVAWAVVNVENKDNWSWFLELLGDDLDIPTGNGLTLISDQHKGLIEAVKDIMPFAEHRQCARHIYEGFRKQFSGVQFRSLFWAASKASFPQLFKKIMDKIKRANPNAHQYLLNKDPKTWSRAFFSIGTNCEAVENGFSECFNSVLLRVRNKPLITMLEAMRVIVLERMNTMRKLMEKWSEDICPNIQKILEFSKDQQRFWHVIPAGGNSYEVRNGSEAFRVDEHLRTCSCRMWQLSGLACPHAIAVLFKINRRPEDYVPACFRKDMYYQGYNQYMSPVCGMTFWPDCSEMSRVLPPKPKKMPGRPRKKRIRAAHESKNTNRLSKAGVKMTCQNCGKKRHNKASCTNTKVDKPPKPPGTKGRPKKNKDVESTSLVDEPDVAMNVTGGSATFEVGGSSEASSRTKRGGKRIKFNTNARPGAKSMFVTMRGGIGKRGRLAPSTRLRRFGSWFELNDTLAQPATQSQTVRMQSNTSATVQVTPSTTSVQVNPTRAAGSFVRPSGRSRRVGKKQPGAGSSNTNAENLE